MPRFSLRMLLLVVTASALLIWLVPLTRDWLAWNRIKADVEENVHHAFGELAKPDKTSSIFTYSHNDSMYHLSSVLLLKGSKSRQSRHRNATEQEGAVYVWPPGQWVRDPEEAIQLLKDNL